MRAIPCLSCLLALLVPNDTVMAADKVNLQLNLQPGSSWTFDQSQDMTSDNKASANGQTQPYTSKMHSHRVGKAEVVSVKDGEPTSIRFTFDDGSESSMSMGNQEQKAPFPYAGKTVTVMRGDNGQVTDDFNGQADPASISELHAAIEQEQVIFPKQPVAVGEEWPSDPAALSRVLALQGPNDRAGMTLKLLSVKDVAGRPTAEIKVSAAIVRDLQGISSKVIMQGTALVDLHTGHTVKTEMKGTTDSHGDQQGPRPDGNAITYHIEGNGAMTTSLLSELVSPGALTPAPVPAATAGPSPPPVNPLAPPAAAPFAGKFSDGKLTADWNESAGTYTGTIALGERQFQSTAHADGQKIDGTFVAGGNSFPFNGTLAGDTLTFVTGGKTYTLKKASTAINPLGPDGPQQPANPLGPGSSNSIPNPNPDAGPGNVPAGYSIVSTTDAGRAMSTRKPDATTVTAALQSTLPDLSRYFDNKPAIARAYEDTRDHRSGGVSFTANLKGQPVNGLVSCKLGDKGATVAVLYCKFSATAADWNKLTAPMAGAKVAPVQLHEYRFPDNTGSIGLADGWTTKATSCHGQVVINGPADQEITLGFNISVVTPTSTAVRMNQQLNAQARQMGGRQMPLGLFVAPYGNPTEALKNLTPQVSAASQQNHGPSLVLDHLTQLRTIKSILPNGSAAVVNYGVTINTTGQQKHRKVLAQVEVDPVGNDSFMFSLAAAAAPDAIYNRDLPTMLAIMGSLHENAAVIQQQTRQQIDAMNQRFAAQQKAQQEVQAAYDDYNKDMARNSTIRSRSNDDFDEVIRGYRTVEDTTTGNQTSVDLGNVNQIVDNLNYYDPGRYKQIPLRDQMDPLPPGP